MEGDMRKLWIAALVAAATAGCSTLKQGYDPMQDVDLDKVAAVERAARQQLNLQILWVNPPMKTTRAP
jgi:uncharacterized lipoprotein